MNDHFRVDTTFDYLFSADFRGSTTGGSDFGACTDTCKSKDVSAMTAYSLMANAYVDIGHYGMLTPYVGAGLGGTYVKWDDLKNTACSATNPDDCDDTVTHHGKGSWRLTYGLMLGTAIDINCNLKADVGYRYRRVDDGDMFGYKSNGGRARTRDSISTKRAPAFVTISAAAPSRPICPRPTCRSRNSRSSSKRKTHYSESRLPGRLSCFCILSEQGLLKLVDRTVS